MPPVKSVASLIHFPKLGSYAPEGGGGVKDKIPISFFTWSEPGSDSEQENAVTNIVPKAVPVRVRV